MVPQLTDLREAILREFHFPRFAMHLSGMKMYCDLRRPLMSVKLIYFLSSFHKLF